MNRPAVILLFGPTGVGKTDLVDRIFSGIGEVVSADALQVYKDLNIGTAKPDAELLTRIPHHLINILHYTESFSIADFCQRADQAIAEIVSRGMIPVLSGGTAYYLKGWMLGLPNTPEVDPEIRLSLEKQWSASDNNSLKKAVGEVDPVSAARIGAGDRYRMLRVLEVYTQTGKALSEFAVPDKARDDYRILAIGLKRDRKELYSRIDQRVDGMFETGLAREVANLRTSGARSDHPGMKAIGYREWFAENNEGTDPAQERVRELIARNSRRYAKRQMTFFSSLPGVQWYNLREESDTGSGIEQRIGSFLHGN